MLLSVKKVLNSNDTFTLGLDKIGKELLLVSVSKKNEKQIIPCYWRLKFENDCPPLEIGISPYSGDIINITCFITSIDFGHFGPNLLFISNKSIQVDTKIFTKANDFNDNNGTVKFFLNDKNLFCIFCDNSCDCKVVVKDQLGIIIDNMNTMVGFALYNLSQEQISIINSLKLYQQEWRE